MQFPAHEIEEDTLISTNKRSIVPEARRSELPPNVGGQRLSLVGYAPLGAVGAVSVSVVNRALLYFVNQSSSGAGRGCLRVLVPSYTCKPTCRHGVPPQSVQQLPYGKLHSFSTRDQA